MYPCFAMGSSDLCNLLENVLIITKSLSLKDHNFTTFWYKLWSPMTLTPVIT